MYDTHWHIKPDTPKALMLAKRQLAELVCDAVNLEGIHFTLPEIQTLLDGVTVGGHKITDQTMALNQANTWREIFTQVSRGSFDVNSANACALHDIAGKDEALEWGKFRSGSVTIAGTDYRPPPASALNQRFQRMLDQAENLNDIYDRAIHFFLTMARCQFFYDVNKRMGRFMMNGFLLNHGYPAINLPARRQLEFNALMLDFYQSNDQQPMNAFLRSCMDEHIVEIMKESPPPPITP